MPKNRGYLWFYRKDINFPKKSLETRLNFCITQPSQSEWVLNIIELLFCKEVNLFKSKEWMPRVVEPMKDVIGCEKLQ